MRDLTILAISGSLRRNSHNTSLLRVLRDISPGGVTVQLYDGLGEIPHYNEDFDTEPAPAAVADLRERIQAADAVLIAVPEYNYAMPGALKDALDWASRPTENASLNHKPVAILGATPSPFGTVRAQLGLRQVLLRIHAHVVDWPEVLVFNSREKFDSDGNFLGDGMTLRLLHGLLAALIDICPPTRTDLPGQRVAVAH